MSSFKMTPLLWGFILLFLFARPAHAFGAGNIAGISKVEGQNWRHGDIEDTLLKILMARSVGGKKFDKLMVSRTYFGNWLRDYSQAIDVGTVKSVSAEAIRLLLCILGFLTFGFGSREFEVTAERLGCYRPEDHIDNPKNYADNLDARQYDRRLRGPVDERVELAIDPETGMKNYIANERANIMTSALHVRRLFTKCIQLGRQYSRGHRKEDLYEALRLMGTGLHCLEDFLAHSNYCELALIEMGEHDVFPHVGRNTRMRLRGARSEVYPCVTGTFGGVDFLHSVTGEVSDKLTQNEIDELEGTLQQSSNSDTSMLRNLLDMIPSGLFGGDDKKDKMEELQNNANAAQMQNTTISPREPEEYTLYIKNIFKQIMPAIEFHDEIIQKISEEIEKIPILPKMIEQLEDQLSVFVFSLIAPFIVPVINQIKNELRTGSEEIIQSSQNEQLIVFNDDHCSDPTHSMLSKDHFSNILNEVAGRTASQVVAWVVPQLMQAWDDTSIDPDRLCSRVIHGVMHHPAQRDQGDDGARDGRAIMFRSVEEWWKSMDRSQQADYRRKLSRDGVRRDENHKEGVQDTGHGHGCSGKLGMHKQFGSDGPQTMEDKIANQAAGAIIGGLTGGLSSIISESTGGKINLPTSERPTQGGGLLGAASSLLSGAFSGGETDTFESRPHRDTDGGITQTIEQYGRSADGRRFEQAELIETRYDDGRERREFQRFEQREDGRGREEGYGFEETEERRGGGRFQVTEERSWEGGNSFERREE
ncbi:Het-C-domain-containing protein, partial [Cryphonectria parasitica EP155]